MPENIDLNAQLNKLSETAYGNNNAIKRTVGSYGFGRTFDGFYGNQSVKSEYNRQDYNAFRPNETKPRRDEEVIRACEQVYDNVGIVKNIIDLMGDLANKGIRLVHSDKRHQKFYREWWQHVNGTNVSERFLNYLYRIANVPVYKTYATMPVRIERKWMNSYGVKQLDPKVENRRIPIRYNFINPTTIEPILPEVAMFTGTNMYAIRLTPMLKNAVDGAVSRYRGIPVSELVNAIPEDLRAALKAGQQYIALNSDQLKIYFYKKDDWKVWAKPMIYSILDDVMELEKMKLADVSALDGAISNIRLWRLGVINPDQPQYSIIPSTAMMDKLKAILANNVGGGTMDLVWGPELDFKESNTQVHKFLGMTKYEPVLHNIYQGLGFGIALKGGGFGDSAISMQTLIERLEYGRSILVEFWNEELKIIQKAMGYSSPAKVQFDRITIGDETGMMKLLVELWDRNVITDEMLQESFDFFPEVVRKKLFKEYKDRQENRYVPKASPYHNPNTEDELKKIILQAGGVTPSEVGLELLEKKEGEKAIIDKQSEDAFELNDMNNKQALKVADKNNKAKIAQIKYKPRNGTNGRPKNTRDAGTRKQRVAKASSEFVNKMVWAYGAQKEISDIITPGWNHACGKKDVRGLSSEEFEQLEFMKYNILCQLEPYSSVSIDDVQRALAGKVDADFIAAAQGLALQFIKKNGENPNAEQRRQIQASAYALYYDREDFQKPMSTEDEFNRELVQVLGDK